MFELPCPVCGDTVNARDIEKKRDQDLPEPVARASTAFDGSISSLTDLSGTAYMAELPCGCELIVVN